MSASSNVTRSKKKRALIVAASPQTSPFLGPVGVWASELTHPWYELTEAGYEADVASPKGGKIELDPYSDPRHESGYSAEDLVSRGFVEQAHTKKLLDSTRKLSDVRVADYDAIVVAGGQGPMFGFREDATLQRLLREFYEAEKITAALCHGVCALLDVKLSDGSWLIAGKTLTGFANIEEDFVDKMMGRKVMPFRIEDEARKRGANYVQGGLWRSFAVRDGRLVTGQQQYSGKRTAELVIEALGR